MQKIPSLFVRDFANDPSRVLNQVTPGCEWVIEGKGVATRKYDGSAVRVLNGGLWARYDAKHGKQPPETFEPCQDPDTKTGHWPGWVKVENQSAYVWHLVAFLRAKCYLRSVTLPDGTYEACGPHFQGNPEGFDEDMIIKHGADTFVEADNITPTTFEGIQEWFKGRDIEGIVWYHSDGRMCKIKKSDFGLKRKE
jgi:hypothetical protein